MLRKKPKSQLTINNETALALFIWQLSAHALSYVSGYLHRGYFAFGKITEHFRLFGWLVLTANVWILHGKVYHKSIFSRKILLKSIFKKNFVKGLFFKRNIL